MIVEEIKQVKARVKNSNPADYSIAADVTIATQAQVSNIESGEVKDAEGISVATFSIYGNLNVNFQTSDDTIQVAIINAINAFIADVKENAGTINIQIAEQV